MIRPPALMPLFGIAFATLIGAGCALDELPRRTAADYRCTAAAKKQEANQPGCQTARHHRARTTVSLRIPAPPAWRRSRIVCGPGRYLHPGRPYWNGRQWLRTRTTCRPVPRLYRRPRCVFLRSRWVRTWAGWRLRPARWFCPRG